MPNLSSLTKAQYAIMAIKEYKEGGEIIALDKSNYVSNKFVSLSREAFFSIFP